jgi:hypothetical protein
VVVVDIDDGRRGGERVTVAGESGLVHPPRRYRYQTVMRPAPAPFMTLVLAAEALSML